jgi:hypothetical protein
LEEYECPDGFQNYNYAIAIWEYNENLHPKKLKEYCFNGSPFGLELLRPPYPSGKSIRDVPPKLSFNISHDG